MFDGKTILITGGTGSFGDKYTAPLLVLKNPKWLIILPCFAKKLYKLLIRFQSPSTHYLAAPESDTRLLNPGQQSETYVINTVKLQLVSNL